MSETIIENKKSFRESPYFVMLVLMLGVFMTAIDSYIFVPALPTIVGDFKTSLDWVSWTMTIFMLFYTAIMPLAGKLSDVYGRKRIYIAGLAIFTIGSIASSLSWDIYSLIAFRGIQAIGGGLVLPAALAAMNSAAPEDKKGKTMGVMMAMAAVAMIVGPNIGGYLIQHFGWRTVFYINVPLGVLGILLASMFQESFGETRQRIDIIGSALLTCALGTLLLGLVRLETLPLADKTVYPFFIAAAALAIVLVLYELRVPQPILDIRLLARGDILSLNLAQLVTNISLICVMVYVPSFAQIVLRMNVQDSGSILTPLSASLMVSAVIGGVLLDKFGAKSMLLAGSIVTSIAVFGMAKYVNDSTSLALDLALLGVGLGLGMGAFQLIMLSWMPEGEKGTGSGILNTFKNIGSTLGSVIGGFFLADATNKVVTVNKAFSNIFWFGTAMAVLALGIIVLLVLLGVVVPKYRMSPARTKNEPGVAQLAQSDGGVLLNMDKPQVHIKPVFDATSIDGPADIGLYEIRIRLKKDVMEAFKQKCFDSDLNKSQVAEQALKAYLGLK